MLSPSVVSFVAYETILAGSRVTLRSDGLIEVSGIDDREIGNAILHSGKSSYAAGDAVGVALVNHPGSITCIALDAIAKGEVVHRAADGKVSAGGPGDNFGVAFDDATTDGDPVEVLRDPSLMATVADDSVTTAKIDDDAVTIDKIADNAVGVSQLADDAVDTAALADAVADQIFVTTVAIANTGSPDGVAHITGQVKDAQGTALAGRFMLHVFLAATAYGAPSAQSGTSAALTNSRILVADTANCLLQVLTHSDGSWGVEFSSAAGAETVHAHASVAGVFATANAAITGN